MPTSNRTWSLPLPVQPCDDDRAAVPGRRRDQVLDDQRPGQRRHQRVAVHVEGVGAQRRQAEVGGELLPRVDHLGLDGAAVQRPLADRRRCPRRPGPRRRRPRSPRRRSVRRGTGSRRTCPGRRSRRGRPARSWLCSFSVVSSESVAQAVSLAARSRRPLPRCPPRATTRMVSSPAMVPTTSGRPDAVERAGEELRRPGRGAQHDQVAAGVGAGQQFAQQPDQPGRRLLGRRAAAGCRPPGSRTRRCRRAAHLDRAAAPPDRARAWPG